MPFSTNLLPLWLMIFASIFISTESQAKHIVGGDFTFRCTGNGNGNSKNYEFTLTMYRDCAGGGAPFDGTINIGIWRGGGANFSLVDTRSVGLDTQGNIPIIDDPCVDEPDNLCVQYGVYIFTINNLPVINESYLFTYQRCCRNETIDNIFTSEVGATFQVEMTAESQILNNSSPVFKTFPPVLICANFFLNFDHSADDEQGDSLVYSFCSPLVGGGVGGVNGGNANGCNGVTPSPNNSCPPPYDPVTFIAPLYSYLNPIASNPIVTLDSITGLLSGRPNLVGQFVLGVCVEEYRGGILLSRCRRDFQFNVTTCISNVVTQVNAPKLPDGETFYIKICGLDPITIKNTSFQEKFILSSEWEFMSNGMPVILKSKNLQYAFPSTGIYNGTLISNKGLACADTAKLQIEVFPGINADFAFKYDTCAPGPVFFTDASVADAGSVIGWKWNFAGEGIDSLANPQFLFDKSGMKSTELIVKDINDCRDTTKIDIPYFPLPRILLVDPGKDPACAPAAITFNDLPPEVTQEFTVHWTFGDGEEGTGLNPVHVYKDTGLYSVFVSVTSPLGCKLEENFEDVIWIRPTPTADFSYNPEQPSNLQPTVNFYDLSDNSVSWSWDFDSHGFSLHQNPTYTFIDTGLKEVTLIVTHPLGCRDTITKIIDVSPQVRYFLPNAFTPDQNGNNDEFIGTGVFDGMKSFSLTIFSRWGDKVFETKDPQVGWNGTRLNSGQDIPTGVYVYVVDYIGPRGDRTQKQGFATLIR
ncbi:MAG: PKD domain-containing protein [Saprospiraceae bacterium]